MTTTSAPVGGQPVGMRAVRTSVSRRAVLLGGAAVVAATLPSCGGPGPGGPAPGAPAGRGPVFTLGVASGDPAADSVVLWTRLARNPLADDGLGGMGPRAVEVEWELATDERFTRVLQRGRATTGPELGFAVHAEPGGLAPGTMYYYRFRAGNEISPTGMTRTAAGPGALDALTVCVASCAQYEHGWFTAYRRLAEDEPDLILFLGDYLYETAAGEYQAKGGNIRTYAGDPATEARTLGDYRRRYAQHHADPDLQAAHAVAPWIPVLDDHEVANNWAGGVPEDPDPDFLARRGAALRAWGENLPVRGHARPTGPGPVLYRRLNWGSLVTFHMLDTRQYRDDQPCGDEFRSDCPERQDPSRSITGATQERWLLDGLQTSRARWDVLGQQVFFSQQDLATGPADGFNPDAWDGYPRQRDRIVDAFSAGGVRNPVVLTGDVHTHYAADITARAGDFDSSVVGTELVTTSITTRGDANADKQRVGAVAAENPHMRFGSDRRGYIRTRFEPGSMRAEFRVLDTVRNPDAPARTAAGFTLADREPGLHPDRP